MTGAPSPHVHMVELGAAANVGRDILRSQFLAPDDLLALSGPTSLHGVPFHFGDADGDVAILLDGDDVSVDLAGQLARQLLVVHAVADNDDDRSIAGNALGELVSTYSLRFVDGEVVDFPIRRRFEIQQFGITFGAMPFAATPHREPVVLTPASEGGRVPDGMMLDTGHLVSRTIAPQDAHRRHAWIHALQNPRPDVGLDSLVLRSAGPPSVVFALSTTALSEHPLRRGLRRRAKISIPGATAPLGPTDFTIDLGQVISVSPIRSYDHLDWVSTSSDEQPRTVDDQVMIDFVAHPAAILRLAATGEHLLDDEVADDRLVEIEAPHRPVRVRIVDRASDAPVAARLHMHGPFGEYLPPQGHHRRVDPHYLDDNAAEFINGDIEYAYVDGTCVVDVPLGPISIEVSRGYEVAPRRLVHVVEADTREITIQIDHDLRWRERGWVTADTHVHFLSPTTALLEGRAEGVHVVNLLASQWGEMFTNVGDFDGATTFGARQFGGDGEFLVRVGSENRMPVLGHISLLGYHGDLIWPLASDGPSEAAIGDGLRSTLTDWARRCLDQGGLIVLPHAPNPQLERAAVVAAGLADAIELVSFNPSEAGEAQLDPHGLADWYRYLSLGHQLPLCGGSDKMAASVLLGGLRTYTFLGEREFTYDHWMEAMRRGNTFVTVGPLVECFVEDRAPGGVVRLPGSGGTVEVVWAVESVTVPIASVEVVVGGTVRHAETPTSRWSSTGSVTIDSTSSTWVAVRVLTERHGRSGQIVAHTSAVTVLVGDQPVFSASIAAGVLEQIEGAVIYVDTLAVQPDTELKSRLRSGLMDAHARLHARIHAAGGGHRHHLHDHAHTHAHTHMHTHGTDA